MKIDLNVVTPEEAERAIMNEIESRGLDPSTMVIKVGHLSCSPICEKSFTFHFEGQDDPQIGKARGGA